MSVTSLHTIVFVGLIAVGGSCTTYAAGMTAAEARQFFSQHHCNACHEVDEARIGPPYRAIAAVYPDASESTIEKLGTKIVQGGAGAWGVVPMPSNPEVTPRDARRATRWILGLRDAAR